MIGNYDRRSVGLRKGDSARQAGIGRVKKTQAKAGKKSNVKARVEAKQFRFGYLVHDVSRTRRTMMDLYMKPLGITRSQWTVMSALSRAAEVGLMQVDLARLLEVGKVTVGGLVDRLEATGHVERRPDPDGDRRVKRVFITEQGFEMLAEMIQVAEELNDRILEGVSPEELALTESVLMRVKENIKTVTGEVPGRKPGANGN